MPFKAASAKNGTPGRRIRFSLEQSNIQYQTRNSRGEQTEFSLERAIEYPISNKELPMFIGFLGYWMFRSTPIHAGRR